jgi:hypothetical protein
MLLWLSRFIGLQIISRYGILLTEIMILTSPRRVSMADVVVGNVVWDHAWMLTTYRRRSLAIQCIPFSRAVDSRGYVPDVPYETSYKFEGVFFLCSNKAGI